MAAHAGGQSVVALEQAHDNKDFSRVQRRLTLCGKLVSGSVDISVG
jgi:hypothetical protein